MQQIHLIFNNQDSLEFWLMPDNCLATIIDSIILEVDQASRDQGLDAEAIVVCMPPEVAPFNDLSLQLKCVLHDHIQTIIGKVEQVPSRKRDIHLSNVLYLEKCLDLS